MNFSASGEDGDIFEIEVQDEVDENSRLLNEKKKNDTKERFKEYNKLPIFGTMYYKNSNPLTFGMVDHVKWHHYYTTIPFTCLFCGILILLLVVILNIVVPFISTFFMLIFLLLNPEVIILFLVSSLFLIVCCPCVHICCIFCEIEPKAVEWSDDGSYDYIEPIDIYQEPSSKLWPTVVLEYFRLGRWFSRVIYSYFFCKVIPIVLCVETVMKIFGQSKGRKSLIYYWFKGLSDACCCPCITLFKTFYMACRISFYRESVEDLFDIPVDETKVRHPNHNPNHNVNVNQRYSEGRNNNPPPPPQQQQRHSSPIMQQQTRHANMINPHQDVLRRYSAGNYPSRNIIAPEEDRRYSEGYYRPMDSVDGAERKYTT